MALAFVVALAIPSGAHASKNVVGYFGSAGTGISDFRNTPSAVAINNSGNGIGAASGDLYSGTATSRSRERTSGKIIQFGPNGTFIRAFGWDVVSFGPGNTGPNEQQTVTVPSSVTAGTFKLTVPTVIGEGTTVKDSNVISNVVTNTGEFQVGQTVDANRNPNGAVENPIPTGTTITAVGPGTLTLSAAATFSGGNTELYVRETTGPIAYNAAANTGSGGANLQASLEALPAIGPGGVSVAGGPGASGTPFTVSFTSSQHHLAHNDVRQMTVSSVLTGGAAGVATVVEGGGVEVCNVGVDPAGACHNPEVVDDTNVPFGNLTSVAGYMDMAPDIAIDQATGTIFATARGRILVFRSDGSYEGAFGWGVLTGAPELQFCTTSCKPPITSSGAFHTASGAGQFNYYTASDLAVDPLTGNLYVANERNNRVDEFGFTENGSGEVTGVDFVHAFGWGVDTEAATFEVCTAASTCNSGIPGAELGQFGDGMEGIAVNSAGVVYVADSDFASSTARVQAFTPLGSTYTATVFAPGVLSALSATERPDQISIGSNNHLLVTKHLPAGSTICTNGLPSREETRIIELDSLGNLLNTHVTCPGFSFETEQYGSYNFSGTPENTSTGALYVGAGILGGGSGIPNPFRVLIVDATEAASASINTVTPNVAGATVTGTINPQGPNSSYPNATTTAYQAEYKRSSDSSWIKFGGLVNIGAGSSDHEVTVHLGGLEGNTSYDVRIVAQKSGEANAIGGPQTFQTLSTQPTIEGVFTRGVTANSAELVGSIHPHGTDTAYHFEYGPTSAYGSQTPEADAGEGYDPEDVDAHIDGLRRIVYHFRLVAHNALGTAVSEDQTFTFYPPSCPNHLIRQQTGSEFLPDCRAYELVSPAESGNVILRPFFRPAPYATNPARMMFGGLAGGIAGTESTNALTADTYVATRTSNGWETSYPGIPGSQTAVSSFGMADPDLEKFVSFKATSQNGLPYVYKVDGTFLGRWPANAASVSGGEDAIGSFQPSPDLSHLAFSTLTNFDPGGHGVAQAPGSAYDYDTSSESTKLISKTPGGEPLPQDPGVSDPAETIRFAGMASAGKLVQIHPGVSTDGSHILMTTRGMPTCEKCPVPLHLYMSVGDAITYEIAGGAAVEYVGMTSEGDKVYFTSDQELTNDDHDDSTDLYMWSEEGENEGTPLTRVSAGSEGSGDTDGCLAAWTSRCGVATVKGELDTDYPIAAESGDIYFYSPELLDGPANGLEGAPNLYVYRQGEVQFVGTMKAEGNAPVTRIQVSPDGDHTAFITKSRLTSYNNAGIAEMYAFHVLSDALICVSCIPNGQSPSANVSGSVSGIFMSDDGRTFFTTKDALVARDTNEGVDVYEYTEGRPQLISSGIGEAQRNGVGDEVPMALVGASASGTDVYFATFETLVSQDRNGAFRKFYDARTGGGFPASPSQIPCEAADECHGAGSSRPPAPFIVSDGSLGTGGNFIRGHRQRHRKRHKRKHHRPQQRIRGGQRVGDGGRVHG